mmetsp:Transcript_21037/g.43297  ORF Transcript_21037/g.43297 Transcript_21037/m.43297 type:complete len:272 (-) Transcript_21037:189-1004(-)
MPSISSNTSSDNPDKASNPSDSTIVAAGTDSKAAKKQSCEIPKTSSSDEEEATLFAYSTGMFVPKKTKKLKVVEKFRAKAALYRPSVDEGGNWSIIGGKGSGGEVVIQMQVDAKNKDKYIPVVRFLTLDGEARMNGRITRGLPILRKSKLNVLFKTVSSSSRGGINAKTIFQTQFEIEDDTDDFVKLWCELAENGPTSLREENAVLCDSENSRNDATSFDGNTAAKDALQDSSNNDAASSDGDETEVEIDEEYAPETQNWMAAFSGNDGYL